MRMETSTFIADTKTGKVYEHHILTEKMVRIQSLLGDYGKAMTPETLLQAVFDQQIKKIVKDALNNGQKVLSD
jgi:hypothetical protein